MLILSLTIILLPSIQGQTCRGCINHDIHWTFRNSFRLYWGLNLWPFIMSRLPELLTDSSGVNVIKLHISKIWNKENGLLKNIYKSLKKYASKFCNHVRPSYFGSIFKFRHVMGVSIMTFSSRPLLTATYEVKLLHPSSIQKQVFDSHGNPTRNLTIMCCLP